MPLESAARDKGLNQAEHGHHDELAICRRAAFEYAEKHEGLCSIEDVRRVLILKGYTFKLGNWAGRIFLDGQWEFAGTVKTYHLGGHGRRVILWKRLNPAEKAKASLRTPMPSGAVKAAPVPQPELFNLPQQNKNEWD